MSSPIPPPPAGSQPSYVPPSEDQQNPYASGQPSYVPPAEGQQNPYASGQPYAPAQPYAQGYPGQAPFPGGQRPSSGLAIAALVVGIISFVLAWVPVVNFVSILGGIAAVVLGVLALRKANRGVAGGKGMAIAGTVLGGISLVLSIVVNVFLGVAIDEAINSAESAVAPAVQPAESEGTADEQTVDTEEPAAAAGGALPLGEAAEVGDYTIAVTGLDLDANEAIAAADATNPAPDGQYVLAEVSVVYNGTEEGNPWMDLSYILQGADGAEYDDGTCMAIEPNSVVNVPALTTGDAADYQVCLDVPAEAIEGGSFAIEPLFSLDEAERATWEIR
ncbi:DUF4190 domain-containing protein [Georgenia sp. EYE_87]|uniref:DUF4190 domain-containing protein n=1 Tax=Georgenia sp. EYE_87 TaxID=2853448 RepID=UPI0020047B64|nr:DUF4190 domain-containing protein [Georgenia sp. EYE_87]MCK6210800.1 DUF4190 domain-containing protein [Georgenia sp. EYE_87]